MKREKISTHPDIPMHKIPESARYPLCHTSWQVCGCNYYYYLLASQKTFLSCLKSNFMVMVLSKNQVQATLEPNCNHMLMYKKHSQQLKRSRIITNTREDREPKSTHNPRKFLFNREKIHITVGEEVEKGNKARLLIGNDKSMGQIEESKYCSMLPPSWMSNQWRLMIKWPNIMEMC